MNRLLLFIAFTCLLFMKAKADIIKIDGETFYIGSESPLRKYPLLRSFAPLLTAHQSHITDNSCGTTNAEWSIINNQLYLTNLFSCDIDKPMSQFDLKPLFSTDPNAKIENGKVKADWFTGDIWLPKGQPIAHFAIIIAFYQSEKRVSFLKGKLTEIKEFTYPVSNFPDTYPKTDTLSKIVSQQIDWSKIPDLKNEVKKVVFSFATSTTEKPANIKLTRPTDIPILNEEALRVISIIPLRGYYLHGEVFKQGWAIQVTFSEELRQKYSH